ncbi:alpha/beta hydrolase [Nonomuraea sp. SMC257]|uniref:Alpha/beta hydrolase n=1 Tax=Nonomuraea montanisoli TaxID=2741721 RepID=A0A7Y6I679_9ACTN|nr:alpha/beta fold hydrolase [Nonomuraea montanisoli]NUW31943.1 alpha/beta hydrolase [Nonomuraea montanisoli]
MATYVLVPGMCHGGWSFAPVTERLRSHGHRVIPVTLTGVAERHHLLTGGVNLDTHVRDVTALLEVEEVEDAVLVGHSYGGMVITGAADRAPGRAGALVYLDAVVPSDGDSCWSLVRDEERRWYADVDDTGYATRPLPFFDPRATAHPIASVLQRLRLTGDLAHVRRRDYAYATGWDGESPFTVFRDRLRHDPAWTVHDLAGGHNLMRDAPDELVKVLLGAA